MSTYRLSSSTPRLLQDAPERLDYHAKSDDLLSFIATKLGFLEEALQKDNPTCLSDEERKIAKELRSDLRYVQAHYKIVPRDGGDVQMIRPSGNLLAK